MKTICRASLEILLGTFHSEQFLEEQLRSIFSQTISNFRLLIRDGGSTDHTLEIIERFQLRYPDKIRFLGSSPAAACKNFSLLADASKAELIMFADHDDVWLPDKIEKMLHRYQEIEKRNGQECPILVFSDAVVTDSHLKKIANSSFRYRKIDPRRTEFRQMLLQNVPSGNTMMVNRALLRCTGPIPYDAVMHDHWLALVAASFGVISYLPEPTLLYRQHERNIFGAKKNALRYYLSLLAKGRKQLRARQYANFRQAGIFLERFGGRLSSEERELLQACSEIPNAGFLQKRFYLLKYGLAKQGFLRTLGLYFVV